MKDPNSDGTESRDDQEPSGTMERVDGMGAALPGAFFRMWIGGCRMRPERPQEGGDHHCDHEFLLIVDTWIMILFRLSSSHTLLLLRWRTVLKSFCLESIPLLNRCFVARVCLRGTEIEDPRC